MSRPFLLSAEIHSWFTERSRLHRSFSGIYFRTWNIIGLRVNLIRVQKKPILCLCIHISPTATAFMIGGDHFPIWLCRIWMASLLIPTPGLYLFLLVPEASQQSLRSLHSLDASAAFFWIIRSFFPLDSFQRVISSADLHITLYPAWFWYSMFKPLSFYFCLYRQIPPKV